MRKGMTRVAAIVAAIGMIFALGACGNAGNSASRAESTANLPKPVESRIGMTEDEVPTENYDRVEFYRSLDQMKKDSPVIAAGIMGTGKSVLDPSTQSQVALQDFHVLARAKGNVQPGKTITIAADHIAKANEKKTFGLRPGEVVLLFLQPTNYQDTVGAKNESEETRETVRRLKSAYTIAGTYVGIYMLKDLKDYSALNKAAQGSGSDSGSRSASDIAFSRFVKSHGDNLPETITLKDVK
jgi:hypothetical protein